MPEAKIVITPNGPYIVYGEIPLLKTNSDGSTTKIESKEPAVLCRCGYSKNKPFCDGSHITMGRKE